MKKGTGLVEKCNEVKRRTWKKLTTERISNIEILRIIAMILVVMHHFVVHGFSTLPNDYSIDRVLIDFFILGGKVGVNLFVLISGYFMVDSKITMKKILKFIAQVWFYSVIIFILFAYVVSPNEKVNFLAGVHYFFPLLYGENWFASTYLWLILSSPLLNYVINHLSLRQLRRIVAIILFVCSVLPVFLEISIILSNYGWFVALYFLAAYIKKGKNLIKNWRSDFCLAIFLYVLLFVLTIYYYRYREQYSIIVVLIAIELFNTFRKMKLFYNKWINVVASATFGVYLIHDNILVRPYLWNKIFQVSFHYGKSGFILFAVKVVFMVYIICTAVDLVRQYTVEKVWMKIVNIYIIPKIPVLKKLCTCLMNDIIEMIQGIVKKTYFKEKWKKVTFALMLTVIAAWVGGGSLYITNDNYSEIEVFYRFVRYSVNLIYMMVPLYFVLYYVAHFIEFSFVYSGNINKKLVPLMGRFTIVFMIIVMILHIRGCGYKVLVQSFMQDKKSEYFIWCLILMVICLTFTSRKYLEYYIESHNTKIK